MTDNNNVSINFKPAVTKRASEIIFDQIKTMILHQDLKPGDRLPSERKMMEMFQRSRPTVREALRMLERGGYISIAAGVNGAVVREPNNQNMQKRLEDALTISQVDIQEMSEYRNISEGATVVWACQRRTEEDLQNLRQILDDMAKNLDNSQTFIDMDPQYHGLIAMAAKNTVCVMINQTISNLNKSLLEKKISAMSSEEQIKMFTNVQKKHEAIYEAIRDRDEVRAREVMEEHLQGFVQYM